MHFPLNSRTVIFLQNQKEEKKCLLKSRFNAMPLFFCQLNLFYNISYFKMEELISKMEQIKDFKRLITQWCIQNAIQQPKIMSYSLEKISKLYDNFLDKYGSKQKTGSFQKMSIQPIWFENQLILFQWAVITLSIIKQIYLKDFRESQIQFLSSIFREKENYIVDYQVKCLLVRGKQIRNAWKAQEQKILASIIKKMPEKNKWNEIARQLYRISEGKYFRQGKHCRERWYSYIESEKLQKQWSVDDDIEMLQLISVRGKKWNQMANKFTNLQNKMYLKKRYRKLLQEAKNKMFKPITQRQAISFLLQEKYLQIQKSKNDDDMKERIKYSSSENEKNSQKFLSNDRNQQAQQINQDGAPLKNEYDEHEIEQFKNEQLNIKKEEDNSKQNSQNKDNMNWVSFDNSMQLFGNGLNFGYFPVQYTAVNSVFLPVNEAQGLNFGNYSTPFQMNGQYFYF